MRLQLSTILPAIGVLILAYFASVILAFLRRYRFLCSSPLPFIILFDPRDSLLWFLISPYFSPIFRNRFLPYWAKRWFLYAVKDANWEHRGDLPRRELGSDVFWSLQPGGIKLWSQDPDVIGQIAHQWKDFPKAVEHYGDLELFGRNVVTTEGKTWQLHRRITSPPFNDANSGLVWEESALQASYMLDAFPPDKVVEDVHFCTSNIALHVISAAGFGLRMDWPKSTEHSLEAEDASSSDSGVSFQRAVYLVITCMAYLMVFPRWLLRNSPSKIMRDTQKAAGTYKRYIRSMIKEAREGGRVSNDLLGILVRSSEAEGGKEVNGGGTKGAFAENKKILTDDEIVGNIYVFIIAGHETTAGVLETAILHLAMNDELQKQVHDEIDSVGPDATYADYKNLTTIVTLLLETLRLYPPVVHLPKRTFAEPRTLQYRGETFTVPPNTSITFDVVSSQRHPAYWGPDPHAFRPSRWLVSDTISTPPPAEVMNKLEYSSKDHPEIKGHPRGSFMAFSEGARSCLGKKFAQVEFVAVIYTLLKERRLEVVRQDGESMEEAKARCSREIENRQTGVAMRMQGRVPVRLVKR